ncbi:Uncharacterised protein [Segatella copri]|nr:Uncharacterised protein [Segatella copri]
MSSIMFCIISCILRHIRKLITNFFTNATIDTFILIDIRTIETIQI